MSIGSCRGEERKRKIVAEYDIRPLFHIKMIEGQDVLEGCCGKVSDRYYHFEATSKVTKDVESFVVGYDCAEQLLDMAELEYLPLFNPLSHKGSGSGSGSGGSQQVKSGVNGKASMAPLNNELSDAIHLLCMSWKGVPRGRLLSSLDFIRRLPGIPTKNFSIVGLNEVIAKDIRQRTLAQMIDDLRKQSPGLRSFEFPLMQQVLVMEKKVSLLS